MLDLSGLLLSFLLGIAIFYLGGPNALILIFIFLFVAVYVSKYEEKEKKKFGVYEYKRSWENVFSNGLIPFLTLFLIPHFGYIPYITSIASIMADKFASELGVLSKDEPIDLLTFKKTRVGKSGAVSLLGLAMSFVGSLIITSSSIFLFNISPVLALKLGFFGFLGSFADSIAGIFEERGFGNKSTSNIIGALVGTLLSIFF